MAQETRLIRRSLKNKKEIKDLICVKGYIIEDSMSNDCDPETHKKVFQVSINGKILRVPTGIETTIPNDVFCVLKDTGMINDSRIYAVDHEFNPL